MYELYMTFESTKRKSLKKSVDYVLNKINNSGYSIYYTNIEYNDIRGGCYNYHYNHYTCNIDIQFDSKAFDTITKLTYLLNRVNKFVNINVMKIYEINQKG